MRTRIILFGLAAAALAVLTLVGVADSLAVDYLWYRALGYGGVFDTTIGAEVAVFATVWLVTFAAVFASGLVAVRLSHERARIRVVRRDGEMAEVNLPELIRALGDRIPWRLLVALA
ncbi:MAG TPA: UPF0182 family protein, partial [Candidatus Binataceae bacterium]|nr:UPF0182 family protein [Candidatus Binataceae bacterium]